MTAFKMLPPWSDFVKGRDSDMSRMRQAFVARLQNMHERALREHSRMNSPEEEAAAHDAWTEAQAAKPKRQRCATTDHRCPACDALDHWSAFVACRCVVAEGIGSLLVLLSLKTVESASGQEAGTCCGHVTTGQESAAVWLSPKAVDVC